MTDVITYNTELEQLLKENSEECESLSILHRMSYEKYNKRSNYINIPVIILSSAIGFITGIDLQYDRMNIILGVGSVFVGIIKSVDTYFQLAKRAESHRICSLQFSQISKKIQIELTLHRRQRATAENMMNIVKTDIKNMQDIAPLIDDDIIEIYNGKYRRYKRVKKPNFVNGLTEVKVNPYNNEREYEFASRHGSREASPNNGDGDGDVNGNGNGDGDNNNTDIIRRSSQSHPNSLTPQQQQHQQQLFTQETIYNKSVEPNLIGENYTNITVVPPIRSSPSISEPIVSNIPPTPDILQMLQHLQSQAQSQAHSQAHSQTQSQAHSQAQSQAQSQSRVQSQAPSPATSVRSSASVVLGEIRTDSNGNHNMSI